MSEAEGNSKYDEVLEQRARILAEKARTTQQQKAETVVAVVAVGPEQFGLPVDSMREIVKTPPISKLPETPTWFAGITQVRGDIMGAVNLGRWFGVTDSGGGFLAVAGGEQGLIGLIVDSVLGFREISSEEIAERLTLGVGQSVFAITKDLVRLVDIQHLLADERLVINGSTQSVLSKDHSER
jgi:purine-binding chemotaxis protein CheW